MFLFALAWWEFLSLLDAVTLLGQRFSFELTFHPSIAWSVFAALKLSSLATRVECMDTAIPFVIFQIVKGKTFARKLICVRERWKTFCFTNINGYNIKHIKEARKSRLYRWGNLFFHFTVHMKLLECGHLVPLLNQYHLQIIAQQQLWGLFNNDEQPCWLFGKVGNGFIVLESPCPRCCSQEHNNTHSLPV